MTEKKIEDLLWEVFMHGEFTPSCTYGLPPLPSSDEIFGRETIREQRGAEDDHLSMDERCGYAVLRH